MSFKNCWRRSTDDEHRVITIAFVMIRWAENECWWKDNDSVCSLREPTVNQLTAKLELTKMTNTKMVSSLREATVKWPLGLPLKLVLTKNDEHKKDHAQMETISTSKQRKWPRIGLGDYLCIDLCCSTRHIVTIVQTLSIRTDRPEQIVQTQIKRRPTTSL